MDDTDVQDIPKSIEVSSEDTWSDAISFLRVQGKKEVLGSTQGAWV
jgi:hypothetical protein